LQRGPREPPAFRAKYDSRATEITVGARKSKTVQLHPITLEEMN